MGMFSMTVVATSGNDVKMTMTNPDNMARMRLGVLTMVIIGAAVQTAVQCPTATISALTFARVTWVCVCPGP